VFALTPLDLTLVPVRLVILVTVLLLALVSLSLSATDLQILMSALTLLRTSVLPMLFAPIPRVATLVLVSSIILVMDSLATVGRI
jgi:hypothetical protein